VRLHGEIPQLPEPLERIVRQITDLAVLDDELAQLDQRPKAAGAQRALIEERVAAFQSQTHRVLRLYHAKVGVLQLAVDGAQTAYERHVILGVAGRDPFTLVRCFVSERLAERRAEDTEYRAQQYGEEGRTTPHLFAAWIF